MHVRPFFNRAGRGNQSLNPLSLWERARVREFLKGRTLVSARSIESMGCLFHQQVRTCRMNRFSFMDNLNYGQSPCLLRTMK